MRPTEEIGDPLWQDIHDRDERIAELEQMIYKFCIAQTWTTQQWKDQPCVAPLFAVAKEVKARE